MHTCTHALYLALHTSTVPLHCTPLLPPHTLTAPSLHTLKVALLVFDSDPILGMNINKGSDPIIGFALCPPEHDEPQNPDGSIKEPRSMKEYFVRSGLGEPEARKPEWIDVYSIEGMEQMALFKSDPNQHDKPANVGSILVDFELRPEQDAKKLEIKDAEREALAKKAAAREAKEKGEPPPPAPAFPMVKINTIRSMPKMIKCYLEVALIGVRDMKPRLVAGFEQAISAPYIEFEYGHRSAPERYWKTKTMLAGGGGDSSAGPNANFLDVIYLQVMLPTHHSSTHPFTHPPPTHLPIHPPIHLPILSIFYPPTHLSTCRSCCPTTHSTTP